MIQSIHQSSLNMAARCGEQFRRRYIEGEIVPPGIAAGTGTGVHAGSEANFRHKIITGSDLPISDVLDASRDGFVRAFKHGIFLTGDELGRKNTILNDGLNKALRLTKAYHERIAPGLFPQDVESDFLIDVPGLGLPIGGRIDFTDPERIHDLKTAGKSWAEDQVYKEAQPIFYGFAKYQETGAVPGFKFWVLVDLKGGVKIQEQSVTGTQIQGQFPSLIKRLNMFETMLKSGVFMPAHPSSWWCSKDWCGYFRSCPYVGN